ncbi:Lrp/AsnC family transcriptional regulator [Sphingobacterium suaedae]|uniref:Lrp/AsnC family transcriptional regulator n=1 Tax=Sphingobacterium suaedae TaxID=1686402 RepID=A0ABW5KIN1_9SPHI
METLDDFDIAILRFAQTNNYMPQREIGEKIGLSTPAVQRRIKRLTKLGFISSNVAIVDREKLGHYVTLLVEVSLESEKANDIDQAKFLFRARPEVQQCYYVTGDTDFILIVVVPSMHHYELLTRELFFGNPNVKHFKTFVAMDLVKVGTTISLDKHGTTSF